MGQRPSDQPYNIILAGSSSVGKTTAFKKICAASLQLENEEAPYLINGETSQVDSAKVSGRWQHTGWLRREKIKIVLWDTGNMEVGSGGVQNVTHSYFRYAVGVVLMYDQSRLETLIDLKDWVKSVQDHSKWKCDSCVRFVLWGAECEEQQYNNVTHDDLANFMTESSCDLTQDDCFSVNVHTGENVCKHLQSLVESVHLKAKSYRETLSRNPFPDIEDSVHLVKEEEENITWCSCS